MKEEYTGILKGFGIILGFIVVLTLVYCVALSSFNVNYDNKTIAEGTVLNDQEEIHTILKNKIINNFSSFYEKVSVRNNIVSIIILIVGAILYIIAKRREDNGKR